MVLIFTGTAQKAPYPLEILSNVASPEYIATLFKLLIQASPITKMTVIAIIRNLITVKVPYEIFDKSLDKTEIEMT